MRLPLLLCLIASTVSIGTVSGYARSFSLEVLLPSTLSSTERTTLLSGTAINRTSLTSPNTSLNLIPVVIETQDAREYIATLNPTILHEVLYFLPNQNLEQKTSSNAENDTGIADISSETEVSNSMAGQDAAMLRYFNLLRNIPAFADIKYQNLRDGYIHPLFHSSMRIVNNEEPTVIPALAPLSALPQQPAQEITYVLQDMPPFGDVRSEYSYSSSKDYLAFFGKNLTFISYFGFAVVRPSDMYMVSQIFRTDKGLLVYGLGSVRISGLGFFFKKVIENSFTSRMVGFFKWMNSQ